MNSTSKPTATAADTIDNVALAGTIAAVIAFKLAVIRLAVVSAVGAYPEPFAGTAGAIWWACFAAGIGTAAVCYTASIFMLIRGE